MKEFESNSRIIVLFLCLIHIRKRINKMITICFACDDKYFELLMVAIHSIQKTNDKIMFIICYNSENDSHFDSIR
jgi:hypothetical protein